METVMLKLYNFTA